MADPIRRKIMLLTAGAITAGSGCLGRARLSGDDTAPEGSDACGGTPTGDFPKLSIEAEPVADSANLDVEVELLDGFDGASTAQFEVTLSNPSDRARHYTFGSLAPLPPDFGSHETLESAELALIPTDSIGDGVNPDQIPDQPNQRCWRLQDGGGLLQPSIFVGVDLDPDETFSRAYELYAPYVSQEESDCPHDRGCMPAGTYEFETGSFGRKGRSWSLYATLAYD